MKVTMIRVEANPEAMEFFDKGNPVVFHPEGGGNPIVLTHGYSDGKFHYIDADLTPEEFASVAMSSAWGKDQDITVWCCYGGSYHDVCIGEHTLSFANRASTPAYVEYGEFKEGGHFLAMAADDIDNRYTSRDLSQELTDKIKSLIGQQLVGE